jgi:hypothetical protein
MIAYFDCFSGISGDMILGSLIDAGLSIKSLEQSLSSLPLEGYKLETKKVKRAGLVATKFEVFQKSKLKGQKSKNKKWKDIEKIINASSLSKEIKQKGLKIFKRLFEVEAKVHGEKFHDVHLHELGAVDCIVDVFGTLIGLDLLGINKIYSSALNVGSGSVSSRHGLLPVPAPATVELLKNIPVYSSNINFELTTPTGAVLISELSQGFGPMPNMRISKIGIGAGSKDFKGQPNILRVFIGEDIEQRTKDSDERVVIIETNIDDMNPQIYEYVMERLFKAGALDVFLTQVIMKKSRPGVKLTVLCNNDKKDILSKIILEETTSIGLRFYEAQRRILKKKVETADTRYGKVRIKTSRLGDEIIKKSLEYEDCKKIAKRHNISLLQIMKELFR